MKTTTIRLLVLSTLSAISAISLLSSCTFVGRTPASSRTTTTSESAPSVYGSTKTTTTRTY